MFVVNTWLLSVLGTDASMPGSFEEGLVSSNVGLTDHHQHLAALGVWQRAAAKALPSAEDGAA